MNCDDCQPLLIDLVCGELPPAVVREVETHAKDCPRCGPDLAQLRDAMGLAEQLPIEEPSAAIEKRIMDGARDALQARQASAAANANAGAEVISLVDRLGKMLAAPQLAMAAAVLLVVSVGAWNLSRSGQDESAAMELAAPEEVPAAAAAAPEPAAAAPSPAVESEPPAYPRPEQGYQAPEPLGDKLPRDSWSPEQEATRGSLGTGTRGESKSALGGGYGSGSKKKKAPRSSKPKARTRDRVAPPPRNNRGGGATGNSFDLEELDDSAGERFAPPPASAPPAKPSKARSKAAPVQKEQVAQGAPAAEPPSAKDRNEDLIARADAARQAGNCRQAVRYYDQLLKSRGLPPSVYFDAAECHRRNGSTRMAATWLKKAERVAALRDRARQKLRELDRKPSRKAKPTPDEAQEAF